MKNLLRHKRGQSTVELALLLPLLMLMVSLIIYAYKINHTHTQQTTDSYAEKIYKYHAEGMIYDTEKGWYVPEGQFTEHIPADAGINPLQIAGELGLQFAAQLGLSELFSQLNIFDTSTWYGAFGQGFTYSLASSTVSHLIEDGNLHDMSAADLETATWAGATSALSSDDASEFFQGADTEASSARELFGSGLQSGLIGFSSSQGDWKAGATAAVGGMINSDTSKNYQNSGTDFSQIMKGAGMGAIQSSASGVINGNFDIKTVGISAATGAVQTDAFARTLPLTGDDPKNSAMYGAFNGAFSSVVSGGDTKSTLIAAGTGALGSGQTAEALGGSKSLSYKAVQVAGGAGAQLAQGESLKAVGQGALSSATGMAVSAAGDWAKGEAKEIFNKNFRSSKNAEQADSKLKSESMATSVSQDSGFMSSVDNVLNGATEGMFNSETLKSLKPKKKKGEDGEQQPNPQDSI